MRYIIHACPQRMWYVVKYLAPSMRIQGITDYEIICDYQGLGNLESCMNIFGGMPDDDGGAWHLQDDVIICHNFKELTELYDEDIVCGYVYKANHSDKIGYVPVDFMWYSFPCIYIPNQIARGCAEWFYNLGNDNPEYNCRIETNKYDDWFFREYVTLHYPDAKILNLVPNPVDHIDYLLGGSVINKTRGSMQTRAFHFKDADLVDKLEEKLNKQRKEVGGE